jgi:hypothetical protein
MEDYIICKKNYYRYGTRAFNSRNIISRIFTKPIFEKGNCYKYGKYKQVWYPVHLIPFNSASTTTTSATSSGGIIINNMYFDDWFVAEYFYSKVEGRKLKLKKLVKKIIF